MACHVVEHALHTVALALTAFVKFTTSTMLAQAEQLTAFTAVSQTVE
jgi:hypothetical protein